MASHFAKLTLHLHDTFPPASDAAPARFVSAYAKPAAAGASKSWWIPQTIADQVWLFAQFETAEARDAYLATVREAIARHLKSSVGAVATNAKVPDPGEVTHWCT